MSSASKLLATAAAVTLMVASAARPVSADVRGPTPSQCAADGTCCFVRAATPVRLRLPEMDVSFDRVTVGDTGLDRSSVRRALRREGSRIEGCFTRASKLEVAFVISPSGAASRIAVTGVRPAATCVASALSRIPFPATDDQSLTEVHVTITARRR